MCGIAGYLVNSYAGDMSPILHAMADVIAHRGPDDDGFLETNAKSCSHRVGLAHRRLSIIDLDAGHQPIANEDDSIQLVFNGEIYNFQSLRDELISRGHKFKTASDTETIVHAYEEYGDRCVEHLRGMFAFAIWDARRDRLFLARDRFGKKPLFLYQSGDTLLFASEIKSILQFPEFERRVDMQAVWEYLSYRYVPGPRTLFKGVRKLQPGSCAAWEKGKFTEWSYYTPPDCAVSEAGLVSGDVAGNFLERLEEAVSIRMVSDVPFGAFLS